MESEVGAFLNALGNILAHDTAYPLDGTLLYVEAGPGMISASVFKEDGESLIYRREGRELNDVLFDLWYAEAANKRWSTMQYYITNGKFEASFTYEPLDSEESPIDRRDDILQQRYGNKQVVYPALP